MIGNIIHGVYTPTFWGITFYVKWAILTKFWGFMGIQQSIIQLGSGTSIYIIYFRGTVLH